MYSVWTCDGLDENKEVNRRLLVDDIPSFELATKIEAALRDVYGDDYAFIEADEPTPRY